MNGPHHANSQPQSHSGIDDVEAPGHGDERHEDEQPAAGGGRIGTEESRENGQEGQDGGGLNHGRCGGQNDEGSETGASADHRVQIPQHAGSSCPS